MLSSSIFFGNFICLPENATQFLVYRLTPTGLPGDFFFFLNASGSASNDSNSFGQKKDIFREWAGLSFISKEDHEPWSLLPLAPKATALCNR